MLSSSETIGFIGPISCPLGSVVITVVMATKRQKVFFFFLCVCLLDFPPHLLCSGGVGCVVATWHGLRGEFNAPFSVTLGFPAVFQFFVLSFLNFSSSHFPFHFLQLPIIALSFFLSDFPL